MKNVVSEKQSELAVDTEASEDESSSSNVEYEDMIDTQNSSEKTPSETPIVVIDNAPTLLLTDEGAVNRESVHLDNSDDGNNQATSASELHEPEEKSLCDNYYDFINIDEDEEDEGGKKGILEALEHEEAVQQSDAVDDELDSEISLTNIRSEYGLRDDAVFLDASKVFGQERNWRELTSEALGLIKQPKGLAIESTRNLFRSISNGIDTYRKRASSGNSRRKFVLTEAEERSIAALEKGVSHVIVELYPYSADSPSKLTALTSVAYEVAAAIIPGIVGLLQWCLVAHYSHNRVTDEGMDQLTRILDYAERLCEAVQAEPPKPPPRLAAKLRIISVLVRFLAYVFRHQKLNTRQLATMQHQVGSSRNTDRPHEKHDADSVESEEPTAIVNRKSSWTRAESETFFDGLRKYRGMLDITMLLLCRLDKVLTVTRWLTGPERYELILREFGDILGHRSIDELREKTVETRAALLALPDERRPHYRQWSFLDD